MTDKEIIITEIERLKADYVPKVNEEYRDFAKLLLDIVVDSINSLPAEQPSEELEEAANLYANKQGLELKPFARMFFIAGANWQKERIINKACDWLKRCIDVDDEVKMIDGEPEAESFIQKNLHRIKVANEIVEEFKKAMEE